MKYFVNKVTVALMSCIIIFAVSERSYAADTVCDNNGGLGYTITDFGTTNLSLPFNFGDVSTLHDINISTDITHTWVGDLTVRVTSPQSGTQITMLERPGTPDPEFNTPTGFGCGANDINAIFDDESSNPPVESEACTGTPVFSGDYKPHDAAPNDLSTYDGEDPNGSWGIYLSDSANLDTGTLNEVCLTVAYAAVTFDKWVSTNNTCSDTLDTLTVASGTDVYYCYTVSNPSTETFTISPGDAVDDQGHDITALETTYVQGASQTVVVGPITAGSATLPDNITTVNNAQVTATFATPNFTGNLVTAESASLTVNITPSAPPANGAKQLYLNNLAGTRDLMRTTPSGNEASQTIIENNFHDYIQTPAFEKPFVITGSSTVNVTLVLERQNGGGQRTTKVEFFNGNTGSLIGTDTIVWNGGRATRTFTFPIAAAENYSVGDFVRVRVTSPSGGGDFSVLTRGNGVSQVQMPTSTVINVDSIDVFSAAYPLTTQFSSYEPNSTVYIRATVSDPFGNADITGANITITDPTPTIQITAAVMASVDTPTSATRVYEYAYTIPAAPDGYWDLSVTADEGTEAAISHTGQSTMVVGTPAILISKNSTVLSDPINVSNPKAIPGAIVEYTVAISNGGFGYVDTDTVILTDPLATGSTFFFGTPVAPITFTDGAASSGLTFTFTSLASSTDDVDFSNDGGATFITPTTDASGYDTTSPPINFIRIDPKGGFRGSDGANDPAMQVNFRVRVE